PRESFRSSWVPGLAALARDTRATVSGLRGLWSPDSLAVLGPRNDVPSGTWRGCHQLLAVGHPLPVVFRFFQREAFDDGFVAEPLAQPVDRLFGLGGAAIEQV